MTSAPPLSPELLTGPTRLLAGPGAGKTQALVDLHTSRSEEHTSELQSQSNLVCRLLLEKKNARHPAPRDRPVAGSAACARCLGPHRPSPALGRAPCSNTIRLRLFGDMVASRRNRLSIP